MKEIRLVITDDGQITLHVPPDVTDVEALAIFEHIMNVTTDVQLVKALNEITQEAKS